MISDEKIAELKSSGNWGVRTSNNGVGYGGFKWNPIGEWTVCPKWTGGNNCDDGGLFFQGPGAWGYSQGGSRFELIETDSTRIIMGSKAKTPRAMILAVGAEAFDAVARLCDGVFPGNLYLSGCDLTGVTLPQITGNIYLSGCDLTGVTLPQSTGSLDLSGCDLTGVTLPKNHGKIYK